MENISITTYTIKTAYFGHKNRTTNPWNRIDCSEITPHTYSQSVFSKGDKKTQWRKDNLFSKWYWKIGVT